MEIKEYKKYTDVPEKYRWDLEAILEGKTYEFWFNKWINMTEELIAIKDSKYDSFESFVEAIEKSEKLDLVSNKVFNYVSNKLNQDISSPKYKKMYDDLSFKEFELSEKMGSEINRIFAHEDILKEWIKKPELKNHVKSIQGSLEQKKHKLSDEIEEYISDSARGDISAEQVFSIITDSELDYGYAISKNGEKTKITDANRVKLMKSKDEEVRKSTFKNYIKGYLRHKQSLANLLFQHFKSTAVEAKVRKYKTPVDAVISGDKVDEELLTTLYSSVKNNTKSMKKFTAAKKGFFKVKFNKELEDWDTFLPLTEVKSEYSPEEGQKMVLEALKPMGKEYIDTVNYAFKNKWVDYMSVKNKRSGAYSIGGTNGLKNKYILMNWDGELRSVETLAHEMGHSMHSYYSDSRQPSSLSQYPIFLAEIASIFNELMLLDYLLKNTDNDELKLELLDSAITNFNGTVNKQTMWSNYEFNLLKAIDKGEPLSSFESISNLYFETSKDYSIKDDPKNTEENTFASIMVPHFYYGFYVYKYAIGYTVATVFFKRYKKHGIEALQNYIDNFLSAGARDWPIQILKDAGIDLYDKNVYQEAFNQLEDFIEDYISIGERLFKK